MENVLNPTNLTFFRSQLLPLVLQRGNSSLKYFGIQYYQITVSNVKQSIIFQVQKKDQLNGQNHLKFEGQ